MELTGVSEVVELLARRVDFLETLAEQPRQKPAIVEALDHSRSTVDRAIRDLTAADLVERTDEGYRTTTAGRLAIERYRAFVDAERDVLDSRAVLSVLPNDCDLPLSVVVGATVDTDGASVVDHVGRLLREADRCRVLLPQRDDSQLLGLCQSRAERGELDVTLLATAEAVERCRDASPRLAVALAETEGLTVEQGETPPYWLVVAEREDGPTTVGVVVADDSEGVVGSLRTDNQDAVSWATERIDAIDATDATATLQDIDASALADGVRPLPATLREQGFTRVGASFPSDREPLAEGLSSTLAELQDTLDDGTDVALLGPDDADRRRLWETVAAQWADGTVYYRERGGGDAFEAVGELESVVGSERGDTLVVVPDALASEANSIFDVMQAFSGRADVCFLLTATPEAWADPEDLPIDARLEAFRQTAVETVSVPSSRDTYES